MRRTLKLSSESPLCDDRFLIAGPGDTREDALMAMQGEEEWGGNEPLVVDTEAVRIEWLDRLNNLASQVKVWAEKSGWRTRVVSKPTNDFVLGRYEVPLLLMERDGVEIALNPVGRFTLGADGAVDLYVVPAYDEVASLYSEDGRWILHYVFSPDPMETHSVVEPEALPLSESSIIRVLDKMAEHGP